MQDGGIAGHSCDLDNMQAFIYVQTWIQNAFVFYMIHQSTDLMSMFYETVHVQQNT